MSEEILLRTLSFVIFLFSVMLHEIAHGAVALSLGDPTAKQAGRLTLNPRSHIDPFGSIILPALLLLSPSPFVFGWAKPVPYNPYNFKDMRRGAALVGLAGPLTNLALAGVFAIALRLLHAADMIGAANGFYAATFFSVILINIILAFFNLIPIPPFDGSRLLPLVFKEGALRLEAMIARLGPIGLVLVIFLIFPLWTDVIGPLAFRLVALLVGPALPIGL